MLAPNLGLEAKGADQIEEVIFGHPANQADRIQCVGLGSPHQTAQAARRCR